MQKLAARVNLLRKKRRRKSSIFEHFKCFGGQLASETNLLSAPNWIPSTAALVFQKLQICFHRIVLEDYSLEI